MRFGFCFHACCFGSSIAGASADVEDDDHEVSPKGAPPAKAKKEPAAPAARARMNQALSVIRMANLQVPELLIPRPLLTRRNGGISARGDGSFQSGISPRG